MELRREQTAINHLKENVKKGILTISLSGDETSSMRSFT